MRRVVVTGLGLVTPLGVGVQIAWQRLLAGHSGVRRIESVNVDDLPSKIAGIVPRGTGTGELNATDFASVPEQRRIGDFILYALAAAHEAIADAGLVHDSDAAAERTGVAIGSGIGGLPMIEENAARLREGGPRRVSPFFVPGALVNEASAVVSIRYGFRGPNHAVATACTTGAHAIGDAARMIALDDADVMIAGGTESSISRLALAGFSVMRALSTSFNDDPAAASRPWDDDRDGFVLGEGAGVVVLEERERAVRRGATIYGELVGYGLSGDAHHVAAPAPDGRGAILAMRAALRRSGLGPDEIDYVSAHATSTPVGDPIELRAIREVFGTAAERLSISATKSATGHLLGAAGAVQAIFALLAMRDGVAPPTLNLHRSSEGRDLDLVPREPRRREIKHVLSNSFAFGGANATLVFARA